MYTLYFAPGACSMAAHILLEECDADYDVKELSLAKGEQHTKEYRKINPYGKVPALLVDGEVISQNVAILPYLAKQFPHLNLSPNDPLNYVKCIEVIGWLASTVHPAFGLALHPERPVGSTETDEETLRNISSTGKKIFWNCLEEIDKRVSNQPWMMGENYTFVDPYVLVFYNWGVRLELSVTSLKNYTAWKDRMLERPAVCKVLEKEKNILIKLKV